MGVLQDLVEELQSEDEEKHQEWLVKVDAFEQRHQELVQQIRAQVRRDKSSSEIVRYSKISSGTNKSQINKPRFSHVTIK